MKTVIILGRKYEVVKSDICPDCALFHKNEACIRYNCEKGTILKEINAKAY